MAVIFQELHDPEENREDDVARSGHAKLNSCLSDIVRRHTTRVRVCGMVSDDKRR